MTSDDLVPSEHDFTGSMEDWEDRVFQNAEHFRLHRIEGNGHTYRTQVQTFPEAMQLAHQCLSDGHRVLVYAVTETGRFVCLTQKRWDHFAALWLKSKRG